MLFVFFGGFIILILALIALDLGLIGRKAHVISVREALLRTAAWMSMAMLFNGLVYLLYGHNWLDWNEIYTRQTDPATVLSGTQAALQFFMGYLLEQSLSVDNMFVIATIFSYFSVPLKQQHRVLFWGILGALILRGVMIAIGAVLITRFWWMAYIFGALLILTAVKMQFTGGGDLHPERNLAVRMARWLYPVATDVTDQRFFVNTTVNGVVRRAITPLFLALLLIETSDVMFAIDSIPAIFAVTSDPFIVFTSNVFAICGLRSLYFALAGMMDKFRYLKSSLALLLAYIGVKMIWNGYYHSMPDKKIDDVLSLCIIGSILATGIIASLIADKVQARRAAAPSPASTSPSDPLAGKQGTDHAP